MWELSLRSLCLKEDDELAEEEKRLVNAMLNSPISHLKELYLEDNPRLFANTEAAGYIVEFIQRQTKLEWLDL